MLGLEMTLYSTGWAGYGPAQVGFGDGPAQIGFGDGPAYVGLVDFVA